MPDMLDSKDEMFSIPEGMVSDEVREALGILQKRAGISSRLDERFTSLIEQEEPQPSISKQQYQEVVDKLGPAFGLRFLNRLNKASRKEALRKKLGIKPPKGKRPFRKPSAIDRIRRLAYKRRLGGRPRKAKTEKKEETKARPISAPAKAAFQSSLIDLQEAPSKTFEEKVAMGRQAIEKAHNNIMRRHKATEVPKIMHDFVLLVADELGLGVKDLQ